MGEPTTREIVERYVRAMGERNTAEIPFVFAPDLVEDYPQSGERIVGLDNWVALIRSWPSGEKIRSHFDQLVGSEDRWVAGPSWNLTRIVGTGDQFWASGRVAYPNGETWHIVQLIELTNGKISHLRTYFAAPFEPAEWRRPWVEIVETR